jgi:hypothetical protein
MTIAKQRVRVSRGVIVLTVIPHALNVALEQFGQLGPNIERSALAPMLVTAGAAPAARDERFSKGLELFVDRIRSTEPGRVQDLSIIWRLTSVSAMREHRRRITSALQSTVPAFDELPTEMVDPEDRRHFGDALSVIKGSWIPGYAARALVHERDGDKARVSLSHVLVANVPDLSMQLDLVGEALAQVRFDQHDPAVGRARRLAATLDAIGAAVWTADLEVSPGEAFGATIDKLVADVLARSPAADRAVALLAAGAVLRFVILVVRLHGTLAAEAKTYAFLSPLRRSLGRSNWPEELSADLNRAANQVLEQLIFLVRLKMPDNELRRVYLALVGEAIGKLKLAKAADGTHGIDTEAGYWLKNGAKRRELPTQTAVEETAMSTVDRDLALALRESETVREGLGAVASEVISAADFHSQRLSQELKVIFDRIDRLVGHVEAASRRRGLVLKGELGEVVDFSPLEHEPVANAVGARTVRLKTRTVERVIDGQSSGVIVKGDVEVT